MAGLVNKNQMAGNRGDARKAFYAGEPHNCLPKHCYALGAGYKTKNKRPLRFSYTNYKLKRKGTL
jgi:hypothetical protein